MNPETTTPATTPTTPTTAAPVTPAPAGDTEGATVLAQKLAEANARAATFASQIATLTSERDAAKAQVADLTPKAAQAAELAVKVTELTNATRESAFVEALRGKLPGAPALALRGVLGELAKAGKINRFPEAVDAEVAKALPLIAAEVPNFTRPPTSGGGIAGATAPTAARTVSLIRPQ